MRAFLCSLQRYIEAWKLKHPDNVSFAYAYLGPWAKATRLTCLRKVKRAGTKKGDPQTALDYSCSLQHICLTGAKPSHSETLTASALTISSGSFSLQHGSFRFAKYRNTCRKPHCVFWNHVRSILCDAVPLPFRHSRDCLPIGPSGYRPPA